VADGVARRVGEGDALGSPLALGTLLAPRLGVVVTAVEEGAVAEAVPLLADGVA